MYSCTSIVWMGSYDLTQYGQEQWFLFYLSFVFSDFFLMVFMLITSIWMLIYKYEKKVQIVIVIEHESLTWNCDSACMLMWHSIWDMRVFKSWLLKCVKVLWWWSLDQIRRLIMSILKFVWKLCLILKFDSVWNSRGWLSLIIIPHIFCIIITCTLNFKSLIKRNRSFSLFHDEIGEMSFMMRFTNLFRD